MDVLVESTKKSPEFGNGGAENERRTKIIHDEDLDRNQFSCKLNPVINLVPLVLPFEMHFSGMLYQFSNGKCKELKQGSKRDS